MPDTPVLKFVELGLIYESQPVLTNISFEVRKGEHWVVMGQNGAGKTSLFHISSAQLRPSSGLAFILGEQLGKTDMRRLRRRIGISSVSVADQLRPDLLVEEVVLTGVFGDLAPWWHDYTANDRSRAENLLELAGVQNLSRRVFRTLSAGERQQVLTARALMPNPQLLLLDEPTSGLDMGARERFMTRLGFLLAEHASLSLLLITHHIEDVPLSSTHALLLKQGNMVASGGIGDVLTDDNLTIAFDFPLKIETSLGRYRAVARSV
ncbi:MAG: ATP-binding cassette domain-containing protein [Actinomycetota bacterium]|nr:ATP-binding cassette domain-containing protein [Actinomycetota bacterium]